jgi:hypothetical protein
MIRTLAAIATIFLGASLSLVSARAQTPPMSPAAIEGNNGTASNGINMAVGTTSPRANASCAGCGCNCHPQGCLLRKLLIWATYRPKEHVCSWGSCCNSCQYKGVVAPYLYFLNPKCFEGSGISPTFANECYRGYQHGCANGSTCGQR